MKSFNNIFAFLFSLVLLLFLCYFFQVEFEKTIILQSKIGATYKINRIITRVDTSEVAMFGSSRMLCSVIPSILGRNYFNYGINGVQDDVSLFFLTEELNKRKKNAIIINFDLDGLNFAQGDIGNYIHNIDYTPVRRLVSLSDKFYYHVPFIKYYGQYETYLRDYLSSAIALTKYTDAGASVEKNALLPDKFHELVVIRNGTTESFTNSEILSKELLSLITAHKEREFIFIVPPYHPSYFKRYQGYNKCLLFFSDLRKFQNVKVFNFSKNIYRDDMFFDTEHLNFKGATKFTFALKDSLATCNL